MAIRKLLEAERNRKPPEAAPKMVFVGGQPGLALQVFPPREIEDAAALGGKRIDQVATWVLRVMIGGRRRDMGLGGYPAVSLRSARQAAEEARLAIRNGRDPIEERRSRQTALRADQRKAQTFKEAAKAYIAAHGSSWANDKHRAQWTSTLQTYAYPVIGDLAVSDVALPHVLRILEPIWTTKTETAKRLRGRIEQILDAANTRGQMPGPWQNPARWRGHLDKLLARPSRVAKAGHHKALASREVGAFMVRLRGAEGQGAKALEFAILTATRSGETRGARWSEIDLNNNVWTIPAERMKAGKEHRVPLSTTAVELLKSQPLFEGVDLIFTGANGGELSDMTLSAVLRRMKVAAVPHGFRSTFRDWAAEYTAYPNEVCEMALAHVVANKVEAAYRRGDLFEKRRRLMDDWATFLDYKQIAEPGQIVAIRQK